MHKYQMLRLELLEREIIAPHELVLAPLARRNQLALVHAHQYIDAFVAGTLPKEMIKRIGIPWSEAFVKRALASVGGTIMAAINAYYTGFSANLAGGTHHAFPDHGEGFCVFNDIAVAVQILRSEKKLKRVAIIDLDVHQGNGTAAIFQKSRDVYTLSIHARNNYPFDKVASTQDIQLEDGCNDAHYLYAVRQGLAGIAKFKPEMIFYQAGVDVIREDILGRLDLSSMAVAERDTLVFELAGSLQVPLVMTMGGGYAEPIAHSIEAHILSYKVARRYCSIK